MRGGASTGRLDWSGDGGATYDTNLYRSAASVLATDDGFEANGTFAAKGNGITVGSTTVPGTFANSEIYGFGAAPALGVRASGTGSLLRLQNSAASDVLVADASAKLTWLGDTNLYRGGIGQLQTDSKLGIGTAPTVPLSVAQPSDGVLAQFSTAADAGQALRIGVNTTAKIGYFAPNLGGLYSYGFTDASYNPQLTVKVSDNKTYLGNPLDTNLYRSGANTLKTDGNFVLGSPSTSPQLLTLGTKTSAGDPTCSDGAFYYNSASSQFRGCSGSSWTTLGGGDREINLDVVNQPYELARGRNIVRGTVTATNDLQQLLTISATPSGVPSPVGLVTIRSATIVVDSMAGGDYMSIQYGLPTQAIRLKDGLDGNENPASGSNWTKLTGSDFGNGSRVLDLQWLDAGTTTSHITFDFTTDIAIPTYQPLIRFVLEIDIAADRTTYSIEKNLS